MFRKFIFWSHLVTGVAVGLVVAMMSLTGVLLTYERQLVSWADSKSWPAPPESGVRLNVEDLVARASSAGVTARRVTFFRDIDAAVLVGGGRRDPSTYVNSYSGAVLGQPENATRDLMRTLTGWHRWFDADPDSRATARLITGSSNLAFLFLIVSGAYLWLPKVFRWPLFRQRLRFAKSYRNSQDRDFYWHHVLAAWSVLPLTAIVVTAVVISFTWANKWLTTLAGESPGHTIDAPGAEIPASSSPKTLDDLLQRVMEKTSSWNSIALILPAPESRTVSFEVDAGSGRQPHKRHSVFLDVLSGEVVATSSFSDRPPAQKAIAWNRYLHTGESFGVVGQTIAGLVSLASLIMVWTGLALAWRRLVVPLYRRRK